MNTGRLFFILVVCIALLSSESVAGESEMIPLRIDHDELRSFEGLDISDLNVADVDYALPSGEVVKLKHYTFRFFSQRFMEEDWYHKASLFVPAELASEAKGKLFLASHVVNQSKFREALYGGYGKSTAAVLGIASLVFEPNPVNREFFKRTGLTKESEWQDETFERFRKTGDVNEVSFAGIMKANWRAWAAAEKVLGTRFDQVILGGGSKGGPSVRTMQRHDHRVLSVVVSGSFPFATKEYLAQYGPKPHELFMGEQIGFFPELYTDSSFFINVGTNDFGAHPTGVRKFYDTLKGDVRIYTHPNEGHQARKSEQIQSMQLWLAHKFYGVSLPDIRLKKPEVGDEKVVFVCEIADSDGVETVELSYSVFEDKPFRKYGPHSKAKWKTVAMESIGNSFSVSVPVQDLAQLHYTARARVVKGRVAGYLSSPVYIVKESLEASK